MFHAHFNTPPIHREDGGEMVKSAKKTARQASITGQTGFNQFRSSAELKSEGERD